MAASRCHCRNQAGACCLRSGVDGVAPVAALPAQPRCQARNGAQLPQVRGCRAAAHESGAFWARTVPLLLSSNANKWHLACCCMSTFTTGQDIAALPRRVTVRNVVLSLSTSSDVCVASCHHLIGSLDSFALRHGTSSCPCQQWPLPGCRTITPNCCSSGTIWLR